MKDRGRRKLAMLIRSARSAGVVNGGVEKKGALEEKERLEMTVAKVATEKKQSSARYRLNETRMELPKNSETVEQKPTVSLKK